MRTQRKSIRVRLRNEKPDITEFDILSAIKADNMSKLFIEAITAITDKHSADAITVHSGKPLEQVEKLDEISLDVQKLLDIEQASSGEQVVRIALASIYNIRSTIDILQNNLLVELEKAGYIKILRDDDGYAPKLPDTALFGAACVSLDKQTKTLLKQLMFNYAGW